MVELTREERTREELTKDEELDEELEKIEYIVIIIIINIIVNIFRMVLKDIENQLLIGTDNSDKCSNIFIMIFALLLLVAIIGVSAYVIIFVILK